MPVLTSIGSSGLAIQVESLNNLNRVSRYVAVYLYWNHKERLGVIIPTSILP